jgi:hypothetical protein
LHVHHIVMRKKNPMLFLYMLHIFCNAPLEFEDAEKNQGSIPERSFSSDFNLHEVATTPRHDQSTAIV